MHLCWKCSISCILLICFVTLWYSEKKSKPSVVNTVLCCTALPPSMGRNWFFDLQFKGVDKAVLWSAENFILLLQHLLIKSVFPGTLWVFIQEMLTACLTPLVWWKKLVSKWPEPSFVPTLPGEGHPPTPPHHPGEVMWAELLKWAWSYILDMTTSDRTPRQPS